MNAFIWTILVITVLRIVVGIWKFGNDEYPLMITVEPEHGAILLVVRLGLAAWAAVLLFS